jgi:hypothetical protein
MGQMFSSGDLPHEDLRRAITERLNRPTPIAVAPPWVYRDCFEPPPRAKDCDWHINFAWERTGPLQVACGPESRMAAKESNVQDEARIRELLTFTNRTARGHARHMAEKETVWSAGLLPKTWCGCYESL